MIRSYNVVVGLSLSLSLFIVVYSFRFLLELQQNLPNPVPIIKGLPVRSTGGRNTAQIAI